ncbi:MAG: 1,4-alpha-glucan branching protein domain-containing protein [bacterium]
MAKQGSFTFVLHSHLPYVLSHGRWPHGMDWLSEATAECYIPLLRILEGLVSSGISPKITLGLTPVLCEQLCDPVFASEFKDYLEAKIETAQLNMAEFAQRGDEHLSNLAKMWVGFYRDIARDFVERWNENVVQAFRRLQDEGHIEIITCATTHGYLPLLSRDTAVNGQLRQGIAAYRKHFGREPQGIWLPECAYRPAYAWANPIHPEAPAVARRGLEEFLSRYGIRFFIIDSYLLSGGKAIGVYLARFEGLQRLWNQFMKSQAPEEVERTNRSPYSLHWVSSRLPHEHPVAVLTRDPKTGLQVWSGEWGYPGDGNYLDFHKKHFPGGHRYWKVTSAKADLGDKLEYSPDATPQRVHENAVHFAHLVRQIIREEEIDFPIICSPYDTELLGHWWFEGPRWLREVIEELHRAPEVSLVTGSEYVHSVEEAKVIQLPEGSWGEGGFHYIWFNDGNRWTWPYVYDAEEQMEREVVRLGSNMDSSIQRLLRQMARELLLLESSDWQFLISTMSAADYAEMRVLRHARDFEFLHAILRRVASGEPVADDQWLRVEEIETRDTLFSEINPLWWHPQELDKVS